MRLAFLIVVAWCLPGCATLWGIFEVADVDWQQGSSESETPAGPFQRQLRVSAEYRAPAPDLRLQPSQGAQQTAPPPPYALPQTAPPSPYAQPQTAPPPPYAQPQTAPPPPYALPQTAPPPPYAQPQTAPPPQYAQPQTAPPPAAYQQPHDAPQPQYQAPMVEVRPLPPQGPRGTLGLTCVTEQRTSRVHVRKELYRYDGVWKVLSAFMFIAEGLMTAAIINAGLKPQAQPLPLVVGGLVGLDAVGVAILFWHPPQTVVRRYDADGTWKTESTQCPADLAIDTGGVPAPVQPDGTVGDVEGRGGWLLSTALSSNDSAIGLRLGDKPVQRLEPLPGERCGWAEKALARPPWCESLIYWAGARAEVKVQLYAPRLVEP